MLCRGAVARAAQHSEKFVPGSDGFAVLAGEDARELMQMREVVHGPRGDELREGCGAETGMLAALVEIGRAEILGADFG